MWFKLNTDDFTEATKELSAMEAGIYIRLLILSMGGGRVRPLNLTRAAMVQYCKCGTNNMVHLIHVLETMFRLTPEGYLPLREKSFLTETETPAMDTRKPRPKRSIAPVSPMTDRFYSDAISHQTTPGLPDPEAARLYIAESRRIGARLSGSLEGLPRAERVKESLRRHRDSKNLLIKAADALGIHATTKMGSKDIANAVMVALSGSPALKVSAYTALEKPAVITAEYVQLSDNVRSLRMVHAAGLHPDVEELHPIAPKGEILRREGAISRPGEEGDLGGGGTTSDNKEEFSCIQGEEASNVSITRYIPSEKENNIQIGGTAAGAAARAVRQRGIPDVNPSHPDLLRLLAQGVTPGELADVAEEAVSRGKGRFAYVLAVTEARRREAAAARPLPGKAMMPSGETVDELDRRIFGED